MDEGDKKAMLAMMGGHWQGIMNATKDMYETTTRNHPFEKGSVNSFFDTIYNQYAVIDYHTSRSLDKFENSGQGKVGCAKGCHYCCFQHLFISTLRPWLSANTCATRWTTMALRTFATGASKSATRLVTSASTNDMPRPSPPDAAQEGMLDLRGQADRVQDLSQRVTHSLRQRLRASPQAAEQE